MTTKERFLTFAECEKWVAENKEKVLEYAKKNDIPLQDIKITTHTYNILRINGKRYMSNIIFAVMMKSIISIWLTNCLLMRLFL